MTGLTGVLARRALKKEGRGEVAGGLPCSRTAHTGSIGSESDGCVLGGRAQSESTLPPGRLGRRRQRTCDRRTRARGVRPVTLSWTLKGKRWHRLVRDGETGRVMTCAVRGSLDTYPQGRSKEWSAGHLLLQLAIAL